VRRLGELKILPYIHAALGVSPRVRKSLSQIAPALVFFKKTGSVLDEETMVWFQALLREPSVAEAASLSKRLMLSKAEQKIVAQSAKVFPALLGDLGKPGLPVSRLYRFLSPLRPEVQCFLIAMAAPAARKKMTHYFERIQRTDFWVRGRDLKSLGIAPGFQYSFILLEALNGQLDGKFKDRKEALALVKKTFVI